MPMAAGVAELQVAEVVELPILVAGGAMPFAEIARSIHFTRALTGLLHAPWPCAFMEQTPAGERFEP